MIGGKCALSIRVTYSITCTLQIFVGEKYLGTQRNNVNPTSPVISEHDTEILSPRSPFSPTGFSQISPPSRSLSRVDSDDAISLASSSMSLASSSKSSFHIPDYWPPVIMECIEHPTFEEQKRALNTSIRNEIIRALGTHIFSHNPKPTKAFCTEVARKLVKKYPFMKDTGEKESGYVSTF